MLVVVVIEINYLLGKYEERRMLGYNPLQITGLVISILILCFSIFTQHSIIVLAIVKQTNKNSRVRNVLKGLNLNLI